MQNELRSSSETPARYWLNQDSEREIKTLTEKMEVEAWDLSNQNLNGFLHRWIWLRDCGFVTKYSEPAAILIWSIRWLAGVLSGAYLIIHFAMALS